MSRQHDKTKLNGPLNIYSTSAVHSSTVEVHQRRHTVLKACITRKTTGRSSVPVALDRPQMRVTTPRRLSTITALLPSYQFAGRNRVVVLRNGTWGSLSIFYYSVLVLNPRALLMVLAPSNTNVSLRSCSASICHRTSSSPLGVKCAAPPMVGVGPAAFANLSSPLSTAASGARLPLMSSDPGLGSLGCSMAGGSGKSEHGTARLRGRGSDGVAHITWQLYCA